MNIWINSCIHLSWWCCFRIFNSRSLLWSNCSFKHWDTSSIQPNTSSIQPNRQSCKMGTVVNRVWRVPWNSVSDPFNLGLFGLYFLFRLETVPVYLYNSVFFIFFAKLIVFTLKIFAQKKKRKRDKIADNSGNRDN